MSDGTAQVSLSKHLREKLSNPHLTVGFLAGWIKDKIITCVECASCVDYFLPGLDVIGFFCYLPGPTTNERELLACCKLMLVDNLKVQSETTLVLFVYNEITEDATKTMIIAKSYSPYYCSLDDMHLLSDNADISSGMLFRAKGQLPMIFEASPDKELAAENLDLAVEKLKIIFHSDVPVFYSKNSKVLLRSTSGENNTSDLRCKDLIKYADNTGSKEKNKNKRYKEKISLNFDILLQTTGDAALQNNVNHTLVIHCQRREFQCVSICLPIDVLVVAQESDLTSDIYKLFTRAILLQLDKFTECLMLFNKGCEFPTAEAYHFYSCDWDFPFSVVYPSEKTDEELGKHRTKIHSELLLPIGRPYLRKSNRHFFPDESTSVGHLTNTHIGLPPSGIQGGITAIVYGKYTYHHYMQDHINDDGWGCAYRSLQTIISWFRHQGYTEKKIPTHKEIQQALVDVGDKAASFVGSRQWIGSQEVSFCLDQIIGVTCKILFVSSGAELANKGRELVNHFNSNGTPIMIGGGVLAHTILGVDFNQHTGDLKFLVLDPHYTGSEDLSVIQNKGWCGWKGVQFWDQTAFYNLCLPQRPLFI